jgi:hypothetical protein
MLEALAIIVLILLTIALAGCVGLGAVLASYVTYGLYRGVRSWKD